MSDIQGSADFSDDRFRWRLDRWWADGPRALLCMANPSKAGAVESDPTITRCNKLFRALGYPGYTAVNWHPYIATDPGGLHAWRWNNPAESDAAQKKNVALIRRLSAQAAVRLVAWGNLVPFVPHTQRVLAALSLDGQHPLHAFALTKAGKPRHPMARGKQRLKIGEPLIVWREKP